MGILIGATAQAHQKMTEDDYEEGRELDFNCALV